MTFHPFCAFFRSFRPSQWSTLQSGPLAHDFPPYLRLFPQLLPQLVVHSPKWTTSSQLFSLFTSFSTASALASGPLRRVDHWLTKKRLGLYPSRFFILPMSFLATENGL